MTCHDWRYLVLQLIGIYRETPILDRISWNPMTYEKYKVEVRGIEPRSLGGQV